MNRKTTIASIITFFLVIVLIVGCSFWQKEVPVARGPQTKCYSTSGGDKWVCGSGGEFEIQSGGTLDIQSGATAGIGTLTVANGLTVTAGGATITAGGLTVTAGGATITAGGLDMTNDPISNIGAAGTDFDDAGGLKTASTITVTTGGLLVSAGGATITAGGLTLSDGDAVVADDVRVTAQTAITVTNATAFTATGTYQGIQAAGWVTPTITAGTAGDLLILINISAQNITIEDTGVQMLTADFAMGQYDVLMLLSDGTNWLEVSRANN